MNLELTKVKIVSFIILILFLTSGLDLTAGLSGTYYIDAADGNDLSSGKSESEAWKTFTNVNKTVLSAGTKILLKRGAVWNHRLEIRGSGTVDNWITVSAYGTSEIRPLITLTNNINDIGILICDLDKTTGIARAQKISYIEIKDIEIANSRLGIFYRVISGTQNTGFRVSNVIFNNINCDEVMAACNAGNDKDLKHAEISRQLSLAKGNLQTLNTTSGGGSYEYIFPAAIFVGGQVAGVQTVSGTHTTVLTEFEVADCKFFDGSCSVMSSFYFPFIAGSDVWRQLIYKVKISNCVSTGSVNGAIGFDGVNGGAVADENGVMQADENGWGVIKHFEVNDTYAHPDRTWPDGTTAVILSNSQNFLVDSCEFSNILNQGNPDGCGFDFETDVSRVTIQNTKFFSNDGHSILVMNSGPFGGNTDITIQKNLFANNVKSSPSLFEFSLSNGIDGHKNIRIRNNIAFLRKTNIDNLAIGFINSNRTYITASDNDVYYLDEAAQPVTVTFLGKLFTYNAIVSAVLAPQISNLLANNGDLYTDIQEILITSVVSKGSPNVYLVSENSGFSDAQWLPYEAIVPFSLSPNPGIKTVYFKVKNISGVSSSAKLKVSLKGAPKKLDAGSKVHTMSASIYPNPAVSLVNVAIDNDFKPEVEKGNSEKDIYTVTVMTTDGIVLDQSRHSGDDFFLDLSPYQKGTLLIRMVGNNRVVTKAIVKN